MDPLVPGGYTTDEAMARTRAVRYERDSKRIVPSEHARRITYPLELTFGILVPASSYSRVRGLRHRHRPGRGSCVKVHVPSLNAPTKPPPLLLSFLSTESLDRALPPTFFQLRLGLRSRRVLEFLDSRLSQYLTIKVTRTKHLPVSDGEDRRRRSARESIAEEI